MVPIVVVEDSISDMQLAQREMVQAGIANPLWLLRSGEECIGYFSGHTSIPEPRTPCIAFIDLVMAPMSGLELLKRLKQMPAAASSVLIMLSGLGDYKMIAEGYALGASTFICKPVSASELVRTLNAVPRLTVASGPAGVELIIRPNAMQSPTAGSDSIGSATNPPA